MLDWLAQSICRWLHGGLSLEEKSGIPRCSRCGTVFGSVYDTGRLAEFDGRIELDESRVLDEEARHFREWRVEGYRVVRGGTMVDDASDLSGRRVMGGSEVKRWCAPPEPKRARPIPMREKKEATG